MPQSAIASIDRISAVIVGLGQVGSRFDEEPRRKVAWSHAGAYQYLSDRFALVGAMEPAAANVAAFHARCPAVPVTADVAELIAHHRPQIASICTPPQTHGEVLFKLLECPELRLIWCEKPLATNLGEARRMVDACRDRGVKLMVSYNRRWLPLWRRTRALIEEGAVGTVRSVRVALPNRLLTVGSHAVDLALMLGGPVESLVAMALPALVEAGEPAVAALLRYLSGAGGIVQVTGMKAQLIVEAEIIGDDGRLWAREDTGLITTERFVHSLRYDGYRELSASNTQVSESDVNFSPFVAMAENAARTILDNALLECDGRQALEVQRVLEFMKTATS
jgi:predicted dehydrogenase